MQALRFAAFGAGFWSRYQLSGWREAGPCECVAVCDPVRVKAEAMAREFGIPAVYDSPGQLLDKERVDFIDVITNVEAHPELVQMAAERKIPAVCQKPLAASLNTAEQMVAACRAGGAPLLANENWRWQRPIRELAAVLSSGTVGTVFRARIEMVSGFPVFKNQPFLAELEQFVITDVGSHVLDVARFLFGEAKTVCCETRRVHPKIRGEDVATVMMRMGGDVTVVVTMGYAGNYLERDRFPETFIFAEGEQGSAELGPDYWIRTTTIDGTHSRRCPPPRYDWADPAYEVVHSSIVACQRNLLRSLMGKEPAETTGEDNLKTMRLVFAAYDSAATGRTIRMDELAAQA